MIFIEIIAVLILALLITALFSFGLRTKGPWGNFWTFFLVLVCGIWIVSIWAEPVGPVWYGAAWIDFIFVGVLLALILAAATPPSHPNSIRPTMNRTKMKEYDEESTEPDTISAIGAFFWIMLLIFLIAIVAGLLI